MARNPQQQHKVDAATGLLSGVPDRSGKVAADHFRAAAKPPNENGWASGNTKAAGSEFDPVPVSAT
jgi:hypothetical protein